MKRKRERYRLLGRGKFNFVNVKNIYVNPVFIHDIHTQSVRVIYLQTITNLTGATYITVLVQTVRRLKQVL